MTYQQTLLEVEDKGIQKGIQKGLRKGIQKGIRKGIQRGVQKEKLANIRNLMNNANWTAKMAMDMLGVPVNEQAVYADILGVSLQ